MTRRAQIQTTTTHERETRKPGSRTLDRANTKRRLGSRITLLALICATAAVDGYGQPAEVASAGTVSPVATRVIDRDTLLATGKNDLFDALASLLPGYVYPRPSIAEGSEHTQPASYRGFAPDQVAVLLNGVPWNTNAQFHRSHMVGHGSVGVDLNTLPMAAIARIEILEDGASYRYGSGAIGAVINVVLDEGPGPNRFSASWSQHRTSIEGVPKFIGFDPKSSSEFGLFSLENRGQAIDDGDGETLFLTGTWGFAIGDRGFLNLSAQYRQRDPTQRSGLDPRPQYPPLENGDFDPREAFVERRNHRFGNADIEDFGFLARTGLPISERYAVEAYIGHASRSGASGDLFRRPLDDRNIVGIYPDGYLPLIDSDMDDRFFGLVFKRSGQAWDLTLSWINGENELDWSVRNTLNASLGDISPTRFTVANNEGRYEVVSFDAARTLDLGFAVRPARLETGVRVNFREYENEIGDLASFFFGGNRTDAGALREIGAQGYPGVRPLDDFDEPDAPIDAYAELAFEPTERTTLLTGIAYTYHDDAKGVVSGKLAGRWAASDTLALRASVSRNFRAPSLAQAHFTYTRFVPLGNGLAEAGIYGTRTAPAIALGAEQLDFETSLNGTVGVVFSPTDRLELEIDAYWVRVDDRIVLSDTLSGAAVADAPPLQSDAVVSARYALNGFDTETIGLDARARRAWDTHLGTFALQAGVNVNQVEVSDIVDPSRIGRQAVVRVEDGTPDSKLHANVRWERGRFGAAVTAIRYGKVVDGAESAAFDHDVDPQWVVDLRVDYALTERTRLSVGFDNFFDAYPDAKPRADTMNQILPFSNFSPFGFNGRRAWVRFDAALD